MTLFDWVHLGSVQLSGWGWLVTRTARLRRRLTGRESAARWERHVDRAACGLLAGHMAAAWWGVHGGQWSAAWQHTAVETARVTGWQSGVGLLFNFVTLATWLGLAWLSPPPELPARSSAAGSGLWSSPGRHHLARHHLARHRLARWWGEVYLASMWLMAAVVFPRPAVRWGAVASLALAAAVLGWAGWRRRRIARE